MDKTDHFAEVFVLKNVASGYDVMIFVSLQLVPFCLCKKNGILMF